MDAAVYINFCSHLIRGGLINWAFRALCHFEQSEKSVVLGINKNNGLVRFLPQGITALRAK